MRVYQNKYTSWFGVPLNYCLKYDTVNLILPWLLKPYGWFYRLAHIKMHLIDQEDGLKRKIKKRQSIEPFTGPIF